MPHNSFDESTARALDLLPHDDPARSDPRLLRDSRCVEVIRATQEAAADVWLATSPLRAAPPEVLSSVMSKVEARVPLARRNIRFFPWLAASGWVAAALSFMLWPRHGEKASPVAAVNPPVANPAPRAGGDPAKPAAAAEAAPTLSLERWTQRDLLSLRARVGMLDAKGATTAPRVLGLTSPNAAKPSAEEAQRRVVSILSNALLTALEVKSGAPDDPASLVIERGWPPSGLELADGEVIRHRNFPEDTWMDHGLRAAGDGTYYDPAREMIWTRDEEGRGFLGRKSNDHDDLAVFQQATDEGMAIAAAAKPAPEPEGYVIEDPQSGNAQVLIHQLQAPEQGHDRVVEWTDAAGNINQIKVDAPQTQAIAAASSPGRAASGHADPSVPSIAKGASRKGATLMFSLPEGGGITSFRLLELPAVANGNPPKVIVSGERKSRRGKQH